jgi:SAM-dependent methyltransferase
MGEYWDQFKDTAEYYVKYRAWYPPQLFDLLVERFALDGSSQVLDLGCGPGLLLLGLAGRVARAYGVDPEEEMLAQARRLVAQRGLANVTLARALAEDLPRIGGTWGRFRLVTMGRSFHWMDRPAVLNILRPMLDDAGGVAVIDGAERAASRRHEIVQAAIHKHVGSERRSGARVWKKPDPPHEAVLRAWPGRIEKHRVQWTMEWDLTSILGEAYSRSGCSLTVLGDSRQAFEADVAAALLAASPTGKLIETEVVELLLAWPS